MKWSLVNLVFIKEGREVLRDRRTLFVNILLPVLLYPVLAMAFVQLNQLATVQPSDWTRIAIIDGDQALLDHLHMVHVDSLESAVDRAAAPPPTVAPTLPLDGDNLPTAEPSGEDSSEPLVRIDLDHSLEDWLRAQVLALREADGDDGAEMRLQLRREAAERLRSQRLAVVIVADEDESGRQRYSILADDAHPRFDQSWPRLRRQLEELRQQRVREQLRAAGLDVEHTLEPQPSAVYRLAATAENLRVRLASIIPIILVALALSGAFMPAIDLIAGERERGTLETLLSMPGGRGEIFAGKLLVVACAAMVNVLLNLTSLGITIAIVGSALPLGETQLGTIIDLPTLALAFAMLLPLCLTLAAVCLGVAGLAASTKEAQNYLGPLFIVVMVPAFAAMMPNLRPSGLSDLIPVLGPVLVLKELLQSPSIPWPHVVIATLASLTLAWVVVGWSARLLEQERFLFPGMIRAGWGRFRVWGPQPSVPGAMEVLGLFAACLGGFIVVSGLMQGQHPALVVTGGQVLGLLAPVLIHRWLGDYNLRKTLFWRAPNASAWGATLTLVPIVIILSIALGQLQAPYIPAEQEDQMRQMEVLFERIRALGGIPLIILVAAVVPGICEEVLCRGSLLSGLRKGLGSRGAIILSAIIFGLMHMSPYRFLSQAVLGVILAILVLRSGSLLTAIVVHIGHNAGILIIAFTLGEVIADDSGDETLVAHPYAPLLWAAVAVLCLLAVWRVLKPLPAAPER